MKAHYLGHIVFYVRDLETSVSFYEVILGWKRIESNALPFKAAALTSGRTHHELLLIEVGDAPKSNHGHRIGFYHAAFKIGDTLDELKSAYHELQSAGVNITGMSDHTVSKSIYLIDPDRNEIELYVDDPNQDWEKNPSLVLSPIKLLRFD
jgi:catechol 2,3-dioxygenase